MIGCIKIEKEKFELSIYNEAKREVEMKKYLEFPEPNIYSKLNIASKELDKMVYDYGRKN